MMKLNNLRVFFTEISIIILLCMPYVNAKEELTKLKGDEKIINKKSNSQFILPLKKIELTPSSEAISKKEEVYTLPAFEVSAEQDRGYYSANTLAGSRTDTAIQDTPMTISVINQQMLEDLNIVEAGDLADLIASAETVEDETGNNALRFRGFTSGLQHFEFMPRHAPIDHYNIERTEVVRGSNSLIYGQAAPGGKINLIGKTANFGRNTFVLKQQVDDRGSFRTDLDANRIINDKLALRVMGYNRHSEYQQDLKEVDIMGITTELNYRPNRKTSIRLHLETIQNDRNSPPGTYKNRTNRYGGSGIPDGLPAVSNLSKYLPKDLIQSIINYNDGTLHFSRAGSDRRILLNINQAEDIDRYFSHITPKNTGTYLTKDGGRESLSTYFMTDITHVFSDKFQFKSAFLADNTRYKDLGHNYERDVYGSYDQGAVEDEANEYGGIGAADEDRLFLRSSWRIRENKTSTFTTRNTFLYEDEFLGSSHKLLLGFDYNYRSFDTRNYDLIKRPTDIVNWDGQYKFTDFLVDLNKFNKLSYDLYNKIAESNVAGEQFPNVPIGTQGIFALKTAQKPTIRTSSIWTALQSAFFDKKLHTMAGARFDYIRLNVTYNDYQNGGVGILENPVKLNELYHHISPSIGALYWFEPNVAIFANFSGSIESPTGWRIDPAGKTIDPETGIGFEYGLKFNFLDGKINGQLMGFSVEKQNEKIPFPSSLREYLYPIEKYPQLWVDVPLSFDPTRFRKAFQHIGTQIPDVTSKSKGFEADIYFNPNHKLSLFLGYAFTDAYFKEVPLGIDEGATIPGTSAHKAIFTARYNFGHGLLKGFFCGMNQRYQSKSLWGTAYMDTDAKDAKNRKDLKPNYIAVNPGETVEKYGIYLDDSFTTEVFVGWGGKFSSSKSAPKYRVQLSVKNLLDNEALIMRGSNAYYIENRNFVLSASASF